MLHNQKGDFMSLPSFFVDEDSKTENSFVITGDENKHLATVLRLGIGEQIEVMQNDGFIHRCELVSVGKKESVASIKSSRYVPNRSKITVFMALIMSDRMDWAVQKVTELGVERIIPFDSEYCTVKDKGNKLDRLIRISISASKQSGRATLPQISRTMSFDEICKEVGEFHQIILAYEGASQNAKEVLSSLDKNQPIALIVGSEGGFSNKEVEKLIKNGAKVISMGNTILRAETASVALVSAVNYELGIWEKVK